MAKPTVVTKDRSFATVHPNIGLGTHHKRGCYSFRGHAARGLRGGLPPKISSPDSSRQAAADPAPFFSQSHRELRPFTSHRTG
jgi:hypothetical protein